MKFAIHEFLAADYTRAQLLDVLVIVALKTISNYTNHLAKTPLAFDFVDVWKYFIARKNS
ncbi:MAG: hypothetical protein L0Z50_30435 [Verrucomicrobiales bacterium]|nr:hypothetical protein [Verrucomicrobiales bacterium]